MSADPVMRAVVVGYDGSALARAAVAHAVRLAGGGRVVLVYARAAPPPRMTARWQELLSADDAASGEAALADIARGDSPDLDGASWEARVVPGPPADALVAVARDVGADVVVVGSHGYGGIEPTLGSVSNALLRIADRPVMVIPRAAVGGSTGSAG